ncbi:MAG: transcriptional regulator [Proteobacteria bacterium]|nr:transcriptional regulator [Pseudomonadota bacterium]
MNFQQLRYVRETVRRNLNLTEAANALFTSQPGVSKQIKELEEELGVEIFERRGRRFVGLTEPGKALVKIIERVLQEADNLKRVGREHADADSGGLTVATTHTQARYALPKVVAEFRKRHPKVHLSLLQGNPQAIAQMVLRGEADIAIATEALDRFPDLLALPGYEWTHSVVVQPKHPLAKLERVTLADLARYPIVTYSPEFTGRTHINDAFTSKGLEFDVVLTAIDSDVIKTYVELGLGIGIIAGMAYDPTRDRHLKAIEAGQLFGVNTTRVAIKRGAYVRAFAYDFIELFAPKLTRRVIEKALAGESAK